MKKQFLITAVTLLAALGISGCAPGATNPPGSGATATVSLSPAVSASSIPSSVPTAAPGGPTGTPSESSAVSVQPSSSPMPDPKALTLQLEPAYPNLSFDQPLYYTVSSETGRDVYVVERTGKIKVFADNAAASSAGVFLDISSLVYYRGQEQGLLGLAFHPDYSQNGYFYVNYTTRDSTVIARYTRQNGNDIAADPSSGLVILTFKQPYANHNGGHLAFGPDGYLYIAAGDGGSSGDPQNNAQNLTNLLGKILRINVDSPSGGNEYGIPADNPFAGNNQGFRPEIYAYGLRNPWRFSFDSLGNLWAADVGQNKIEEIDLIVKGGNYGWSVKEGTQDYKSVAGIDFSSLVPPVWEYDHSLGESVTGGYVYEGSQFPALRGAYIYGDFVSGRIWALWRDDSGVVHNELILDSTLNISSFGIDAGKEIMIVDLRGKIYRLKAAI